MRIELILIALAWGVIAGVLATLGAASLASLCSCLHGLVMGRWKRLADKTATGLIRPALLLRLIGQTALLALLCVFLIRFGHNYAHREFGFFYEGTSGILFAVGAGAAVIGRLRSARDRLARYWRMSHEFDYAEKRKRTRMLRS